ncbi:MAG: hypothetical protein WDZ30_11060 [Cellvibrionaceae bacterium]
MNLDDWDNSYNDDHEILKEISDVELLLDVYGRFPTFDSAEIMNLKFIRGNTLQCMDAGNWGGHEPVSLTAKLFVFDERFADTDERRNPAIVTMTFNSLDQIHLDGFNYQNSMCGLGIRRQFLENLKKNLLRVDWGGAAIKHDVSLVCESIKIEAVKKLY